MSAVVLYLLMQLLCVAAAIISNQRSQSISGAFLVAGFVLSIFTTVSIFTVDRKR